VKPDEDDQFWNRVDQLVASHPIVIDRPAGTSHPRFQDIDYPFDYGYLDGTGAIDGDGVDWWRGSLPRLAVTGAIMTVDVVKAYIEAKWPVGCMADEMELALATHHTEWQSALLIFRNE